MFWTKIFDAYSGSFFSLKIGYIFSFVADYLFMYSAFIYYYDCSVVLVAGFFSFILIQFAGNSTNLPIVLLYSCRLSTILLAPFFAILLFCLKLLCDLGVKENRFIKHYILRFDVSLNKFRIKS
jgi:hypothetical protein